MDLAGFRALSFDCYGTLIDWETGILAVLRPWAVEAGLDADDETLLAAFGDSEADVERELPTLRYPHVLAESFHRVGAIVGADVSAEWAGSPRRFRGRLAGVRRLERRARPRWPSTTR